MDEELSVMVEEEEEEEGNNKEEEVASETSERSRKSDVATNTETSGGTVAAREQDPYRASRRLPLPRHVGPVIYSLACTLF